MVFPAPLRVRAARTMVAGSLAACGVDSVPNVGPATPGSCETYVPPTTFDATSPTVSFSQDVMPLLTRSCAYASCHGDPQSPTGGLYLGAETSETYLDLVGVASMALPSMLRVKGGDPAESLLQHKIDDDACTLAACAGVCAQSMPQGQDLLAVTDRLTIRSWIAQGALADFPIVAIDGGGAMASMGER